MKKKIIIGVITVFTIFLIGFTTFYFYSLNPVNKNNTEEVIFTVEANTSKVDIAKKLKKAKLIRNDKMAIIYMFFNSDLNLQAGTYSLNQTMSTREILSKFKNGDIRVETVTLTLVEGKRLTKYVEDISKSFGYSEDEIIEEINSEEFLEEMVDKYWFLTDSILNDNIYYGLEGYIMPDTYEFMSNYSIKDIFIRLLDYTDEKLTAYKDEIEKSDYSIHEILTMASIIELEANTEENRKSVSQVIYKRLDSNMSLGMDVTTYYATQKDMGEELTYKDLISGNAYNTRNTNMVGLPVGPICNPSAMSINAVFNPSNTDYLYFYADVKTGLVYFAKTSAEFNQIIKEVG
jgi:UPF0755 protein